MKQARTTLIIITTGPGLTLFTRPVTSWVDGQGIGDGLLTLFIRHTSASLLIQENADPDVLADLRDFFARIAPRVVWTPRTTPFSMSIPVTSQFWIRSTPRWSAPRA